MSKIRVIHKKITMEEGMTITVDINKVLQIDIMALDFEEKHGRDRDREYTLVPRNPEAASSLLGLFPKAEWDSYFYVYFPCGDLPDRPYLYFKAIPKEKNIKSLFLAFKDITEAEYNYLRELYTKMFPAVQIKSLEEYYASKVDFYLSHDESGPPIGQGLAEILCSADENDYYVISKMFYDMREEYMEENSIRFSKDKFYSVINRVVLAALVDRAKQ